MLVTIWGTRGSIPAPGPETIRYGGNTSCVEVRLADGSEIILDAGTGIRKLGDRLMREAPEQPVTVLISHPHWDHVHGFPFFSPAYHEKAHVTVAGWANSIAAIRDLLHSQMDGLSFPLEFGQLKAHVDFLDLGDGITQVRGALLSLGRCAHPGGCSCFCITAPHEGSVVYVTDNELSAMDSAGPGRREALVELCAGADLLIHDAQYLPEETARHAGWGHSAYEDVVDLAGDACVERLLLSHHDPNRTDEEVDEVQWRAQEYARTRGFGFPVEAAREGMTLAI
jgi:phosphoribosyl 1,2-cyclic phosphodiesterase